MSACVDKAVLGRTVVQEADQVVEQACSEFAFFESCGSTVQAAGDDECLY